MWYVEIEHNTHAGSAIDGNAHYKSWSAIRTLDFLRTHSRNEKAGSAVTKKRDVSSNAD